MTLTIICGAHRRIDASPIHEKLEACRIAPGTVRAAFSPESTRLLERSATEAGLEADILTSISSRSDSTTHRNLSRIVTRCVKPSIGRTCYCISVLAIWSIASPLCSHTRQELILLYDFVECQCLKRQ